MTNVTDAFTNRSAPAPLHRNPLYWAVADGLVLAKRSLIQIPRMPEMLVFATIQPVMFVLLFRYVFGGAINVGGVSYVNYLMAGIFVQTVAFGAVTTGIGLAADMQLGLIDRFCSLPMARSAVLTGRIVADLMRNAFIVLVMLLAGFLVGFRPWGDVADWAAAIALLLLLSFAMSWIAATVGLVARTVEATQSAGFIWLFPLTFVSSAFVRTSTMPGWLQVFADHQPVTIIVNAVRAFLLGEPAGTDGWLAFVWCGALVVIFVPLAVWLYQRRTAG